MNQATQMRGYTLLEVLIVASLSVVGLGVAFSLMGSAERLSGTSQQRTDAASRHVEAHASLRTVLVNASLATVTHMDGLGAAHAPRFQRVEGSAGGAVTLGALQEIAYVRTHANVPGVGPVGRLELREPGTIGGEVLATGVLEGSWKLTLAGRVASVRLGVVIERPGETPQTLVGTASLFLENP